MKDHTIQKAIQILPDLEEKHYIISSPDTALSSDLQIDLLNSGGKEISSSIQYWQLNMYTYHADLSSLPGGVYHLRVMDHDTYFVKRLIVQ